MTSTYEALVEDKDGFPNQWGEKVKKDAGTISCLLGENDFAVPIPFISLN